MDPDTAERLLSTGRDPAFPELDRLYAAASAPPWPDELTGLDPALAAFEEAGRVGRPAPAPRRRLLRPLAAAAALAAVLAGGVAVAAETGSRPGGGPAPTGGQASSAPPRSVAATPSRGGTAPARPTASGPGRTLSPSSPALPGLCRAWDAHRRNPNGPPMRAEAMRDLAAAAGGEERIPAFCAPVLTPPEPPRAPATTRPGAVPPTPSHPAGKGTDRPAPSPGKKGSDR